MPTAPSPGSAAERSERVLVTALILSRTGLLGMMAVTLPQTTDHREYQMLLILVPATAASLGLMLASYLRGSVSPAWTLLDWAVNAVILSEPRGSCSYVQLASLALGLPRWPLRRTLLLAGALPAPTSWAAWRSGTNPLWHIVPDALAIVVVAGLTWVIVTPLRLTAANIDQTRATAVARTEQLARDREHARQARALRQRILGTLRALAAAGAVPEPAMRARLAAETVWLERFIDGTEPRPEGLLAALREVASSQPDDSLLVRLDDSDAGALPPLRAEEVTALAGAVWEALTNVAKHAGVDVATVRVSAAAGRVAVEVRDAGRGFDPAGVVAGTGLAGSIRQRMADIGGSAAVVSAPGSGTTVRLAVPADPADPADPAGLLPPGERGGAAGGGA